MDPVEQAVKRLMATVRCSVCGSCYESDRVSVLGHQDEIWFVSVTCGNCRTQGLVAALIKDARKVEAEDGSASGPEKGRVDGFALESKEILSTSRVASDDVQRMREFLNGFDGDFGRLFDRP